MKNDPSRTVVSGPLARFAEGFVVELSARGYTPGSAHAQMCLMAHVSRWLETEGLGAAELSPIVVERFLATRRAAGYSHYLSARALESLLAHLRGLDVVAPASTATEVYGSWAAARADAFPDA